MEATGKLTSRLNDGSATLGRTVDRASIGAHDVIDKVSEATVPMVDRIAAGAHQAVDKLAGAGLCTKDQEERGAFLKGFFSQNFLPPAEETGEYRCSVGHR